MNFEIQMLEHFSALDKKCKKFGIKRYGLCDGSGYTCDIAAYS